MELEYEFDDMGIPLGGGWSMGSLNGKCVIGYDRLGEWWIEGISVEIHKWVNGQWSRIVYMLDVMKPDERKWYFELREMIAKTQKRAIDEAVADALPITYSNVSHISAGRAV
jgi:hypothetical protein